ncbi:MAG: tRNA dihydrouridine synthase DusB [Bacteroidota bacterium]
MQIGKVSVDKGLLLAPMEDITDLPFRLVCKRLGADIVYTEFISSEGLVRDARRSMEKLNISEDERPVSIQIFGGDEAVMHEAGRRATEANPDFIDINCGCWVKNVVARNAGAALLKDPPQMARITKAVVDSTHLPVTVKTRLGWDPNSIVITDVAKMLEDVGIQALTIHCRTRDMGHRGNADWAWVTEVKKHVKIPVILNGDVNTPQDVIRAFETGADAVMIGRAAITNPYIFHQSKVFMATGVEPEMPSIDERIDLCLEHLRLYFPLKSEKRAIHEFRKFYTGYLRGMYCASSARQDLVRYESYAEVEDRLNVFKEFLKNHEAASPGHFEAPEVFEEAEF